MRLGSGTTWNTRALPWVIAGAWALGCAAAFWYFEVRFARPFTTLQATRFEADSRQRSAEQWFRERFAQAAKPGITVVNVFTPDCPCNRFTDPHRAEIAAAYRPRGVRFESVAVSAAPDWVTSTPAALVFDAHGRLAYFGPYSDAADCGSKSGLVEPVLKLALRGRAALPQSLWAGGCFCSRTANTA